MMTAKQLFRLAEYNNRRADSFIARGHFDSAGRARTLAIAQEYQAMTMTENREPK